jgi:PAS domain-containing protein
VYRDGAWRAPGSDPWWENPAIPRVQVDVDGWIEQINATAQGLLGIDPDATEPRHFTDFVVPGALDDSLELFDIVRATGSLEATLVLRPTTGDLIGVDVRVISSEGHIVAVFRLASDVDLPMGTERLRAPERVEYLPQTDVAFRAYGKRALARMPEPTPDGLALRLRRLYPHARVEVTADAWVASRDHGEPVSPDAWWEAPDLPRVRYNRMALIIDANAEAATFFGRSLTGHHWQEFVTPGSTEEVGAMLEILAEAGAAESRFRMPRGDGELVEFDSYTEVQGEEFSTVFRLAASS